MHATVHIPRPCSADWSVMTPEGKGRHCKQCCKTVVDFTQWEPQDILAYLKQHAASGVCGHFRNDQLNRPVPSPEVFVEQVNRSFLSFAQKIAAVLLFVFAVMGASCNTAPSSSAITRQQQAHLPAAPPTPGTRISGDTVLIDEPPRLMGEPAMVQGVDTGVQEPGLTTGGAPEIAVPSGNDSSPGNTTDQVRRF